ncbi:MAG: ABC transporter ATP-binding protein [Planctomycetes bacterium]|nr:ABC transporter ATP-binding protein [Planctomycetota bacterium]MCH9727776.1 ABC transporter ATP-binding protein [Planctomycetota bacterium]MCH9776371.1 ABC transporter ATP-binding protein [Planctomycetota bacterium]MCH9790098.1 ABC transporter ATP-binding protein [Planctomycetota bacterium]
MNELLSDTPIFDDNPVIDIKNVSHAFKGHRALQGISFQVHPQSLHGFVGPNGAGKTTTLKIICTLLRPQAGKIEVFGNNVLTGVKEIRKRIGFMPDHFSTYRQMTVFEYLDFFGAAYGLGVEQRDQVINDVLTLTDMDGRKDSLISGLSRGMQQRVSLARVLVNDPDLLLLDEPASGLDPRARIELMEILQELKRMGKTIFISSHILSELAELCDSVTIIDRGLIKYSGTMDGLLTHEQEHPTYKIVLASEVEGLVESLANESGVLNVEKTEKARELRVSFDATTTNTSKLLSKIINLQGVIESFQKDKKHLNQAFLDLTEQGVR